MALKTELKILFWNVAGLKNKTDEFWTYINQSNIVGLVETWQEGTKVPTKASPDMEWVIVPACRDGNVKKGRAKGGLMIGIRKNIAFTTKTDIQGIVSIEVNVNRQKLNITFVYNNMKMGEMLKLLEEEYGKLGKAGPWLMLGDFNARIGIENGCGIDECVTSHRERSSEDTVINSEGRKLLKMVKDMKLQVLNGRWEGDEKGLATCKVRSLESVVDYGITNHECEVLIRRFEVANRDESDHEPLIVTCLVNNDI